MLAILLITTSSSEPAVLYPTAVVWSPTSNRWLQCGTSNRRLYCGASWRSRPTCVPQPPQVYTFDRGGAATTCRSVTALSGSGSFNGGMIASRIVNSARWSTDPTYEYYKMTKADILKKWEFDRELGREGVYLRAPPSRRNRKAPVVQTLVVRLRGHLQQTARTKGSFFLLFFVLFFVSFCFCFLLFFFLRAGAR